MTAPFSFFERPNHIESNGEGLTYHFGAAGSISTTYIRGVAAAGTSPVLSASNGLLYRQPIRVAQVAYDQWDVDVEYLPRKNTAGEFSWDFDTTGGTVRISYSKATRAKYPIATAPSYDQAIDVQGDEVKGVEIVIPTMKVNVSYRHPAGVVSLGFARHIQSLTGTVNSTPFLGWAAGEVLFLGGRGSSGEATETRIDYSFAISNNESNITVGAVTGVTKYGWDVAWVRYQDDIDTVGVDEHGVRVPQFVYVERVYDAADLAAELGFG